MSTMTLCYMFSIIKAPSQVVFNQQTLTIGKSKSMKWNGMERIDQYVQLLFPIFLAWRDSLNLSPDFLRCLWFLVVCGGKLKWSEREEKGLTMRHIVDNTKPWPLFLIYCKSQNCCLLACTPLLIFVLNLCGKCWLILSSRSHQHQ